MIFTLSAEIAQIACWNKKAVYGLLLRASALTHLPHVHKIVPGGGLSPDGNRWIA